MIKSGLIKNIGKIDIKKLKEIVITRAILAFDVLCVMFFLSAGTFLYWQAWVYIVILFIPMLFVMRWLLKKDPGLLEVRMQMKEKEAAQKTIMKFAYLCFLPSFLIPGFDARYGWSQMPVWLVITGDILVLAGYLMFVVVLKHNSYASRIIEVQKGHKVISTGPYAHVRHPMYTAILLLYCASPLALGSYWALPFTIPIIAIVVVRLIHEEKVLKKELKGYAEYTRKVRWRLIPGIW